ncbi:MAG: hypothetical protein AUK24_00035 [Syntrophaceae bacterium CG2_30_49_12]|nr:MAG: hypothetical protein AUK24_00035 [Syntrophaceae bacterium CG2_30_49_12]PIP08275.1 MAG: hypothetical protein COX52_00775 [Syntrophobacterales bacterium CG23_combo_of_CG06-09_8_20_14_all_48_27]PJA48822.1 MAG: hypothetical protein CO171_06455 [Syntrophobacterales bacterium CG_4_9_14_3_um_filter_49_8]PJC75077.1 MAG: hypothetical protein CO012_04345 [Syntrophobacterales bacterium CG_4_8_14_3_um_filter_49_14]
MVKKIFLIIVGTAVSLLLISSASMALTGGPDGFGYEFYDSSEGDVPPFSWIDISESGSLLGLNDDQVAGPIPIGFTFKFYGHNYTQVYVSSNGFISFNSGSGNGCCSGDSLPTPGGDADNIIAAFWDNLDPSG